MLCPSCKATLVAGIDREFETLDDHVCSPNEDLPSRPTVVCPNVNCEAHKDGVFWDAFYGEGPYNSKYGKDYGWIDNNHCPFDSGARQSEFAIGYHSEDTKWRTKWFIVERRVRYGSNAHGDKVGKRVSYSLYLVSSNGGYELYHSGVRMFLYGIKKFYQSYDRKYEARKMIERSEWPRAEWWRKAEALWIKAFHRSYLRE